MAATPAAGPELLIIDTDPGVDDAMALFLALSPAATAVRVLAVTVVHGNLASVGPLAANARGLLALAAAHGGPTGVALHLGASKPLVRPAHGGAEHVHGPNALGGVGLPPAAGAPEAAAEGAAEAIVRLCRAHPQQV